jgi:hypothetical protein
MTDTETNTEKTKAKGKTPGRAARVAGRALLTIIDFVIFGVFVYTLYLILTRDFDFATVAFAVVSFFYLLADAVNQGIKRAMSGIQIGVHNGDDTPTREDG